MVEFSGGDELRVPSSETTTTRTAPPAPDRPGRELTAVRVQAPLSRAAGRNVKLSVAAYVVFHQGVESNRLPWQAQHRRAEEMANFVDYVDWAKESPLRLPK